MRHRTRLPRSTGSRRRPAPRRGSRHNVCGRACGRATAPAPAPLLEFAALAHEIRQPLTAILSNAQAAWHFLALETPDLLEARAALADIITDAHRTSEVIRQLQAFLTAGPGPDLSDINGVIQETMLVRSMLRRVRITLSSRPISPWSPETACSCGRCS